jgi:hypothetical protein
MTLVTVKWCFIKMTNQYTLIKKPNGKNVVFIAPNGVKVVCNNWAETCDNFDSEVIMHLIFNDPMIINK